MEPGPACNLSAHGTNPPTSRTCSRVKAWLLRLLCARVVQAMRLRDGRVISGQKGPGLQRKSTEQVRARGEGLLFSTVGRTARGGQAWDWSPLTYEGFLVILCSQAIASGEEGVSISLVKPRQIPEVETQAHLWRQLLKGLGRTQRVSRGSSTCSVRSDTQEDSAWNFQPTCKA